MLNFRLQLFYSENKSDGVCLLSQLDFCDGIRTSLGRPSASIQVWVFATLSQLQLELATILRWSAIGVCSESSDNNLQSIRKLYIGQLRFKFQPVSTPQALISFYFWDAYVMIQIQYSFVSKKCQLKLRLVGDNGFIDKWTHLNDNWFIFNASGNISTPMIAIDIKVTFIYSAVWFVVYGTLYSTCCTHPTAWFPRQISFMDYLRQGV